MSLIGTEQPQFTGYADGRMKARVSQPSVGEHEYLTPQHLWGDVERGNPLPYTLPPEQQLEVGMDRRTWRLEIVADPDTDAEIGAPLTLDFETLLQLGNQHGVRQLK